MSYKLTEDARIRLATGEMEIAGSVFMYQFRTPLPFDLPPAAEEAFVQAQVQAIIERYRRQPPESLPRYAAA